LLGRQVLDDEPDEVAVAVRLVLGEGGEDDDVGVIPAGGVVKGAATGDQAKPGIGDGAVHGLGRERVLGEVLTASTRKCATLPSARVTSMTCPGRMAPSWKNTAGPR